MSLLKELVKNLNETATGGVTSAHSVAAAPGGLFRGGMVDRTTKRFNKVSRLPKDSFKSTIKNRNAWKWRIIGEMVQDENTFDASDVMSKLDAAEKQSRLDQDTVPFGMEDEDGNIVKVYVRAEQADEFETALGAMLSGEDMEGDQDEETDAVEIAEVLFQLKDKFDIVDVEWPEIEGDVEEEQEMAGGAEGAPGGEAGGLPGGEGEGGGEAGGLEGAEGEGGEGLEDLEGEEGEGDEMEAEGGAEGALQDVIDMLKADAEARKAEAEARAKEAEAKAAEAHAQAAASKVSQEEQVLDMEQFNKSKKEEENETKRLAQMTKYKHDQARKAEVKRAEEEEERASRIYDDKEPSRQIPGEPEDRTIGKQELMNHILNYLRAN